MAPEVKTAKNSKLPKLSENCFEPVGKDGWPPISTWIILGVCEDIEVFLIDFPHISIFMDILVIDVPDAWGMLLSRT
jgi:hypothetical protein